MKGHPLVHRFKRLNMRGKREVAVGDLGVIVNHRGSELRRAHVKEIQAAISDYAAVAKRRR